MLALSIILFPAKIAATIVLFLLKTAVKIAQIILVLILLPIKSLSEILYTLFTMFSAIGAVGIIFMYATGNSSFSLMIGTLFLIGLIQVLLLSAEILIDEIEDKSDDLCFFIGDIINSIWI